jgi:AcrR family transcriptional regulator
VSSDRTPASRGTAGRTGGLARPQRERGRYHHGDLRAALIETAIELIAERGVHNFSLAEASRRLGVAVSAPYAHFADRDELLAAISVHALELFHAELEPKLARSPTPGDRLAATARAYVRFAAAQRPLFQTLFDARFDKDRHPEVEAAERPIEAAFLESVRALSPAGDEATAEPLAAAVEATAHGHAMLLLDGRFGRGTRGVERAADNAARATHALVGGRDLLLATSRPRRPAPSGE